MLSIEARGGHDECSGGERWIQALVSFFVVLSRETNECGSKSVLEPNSVASFSNSSAALFPPEPRTHAGFRLLFAFSSRCSMGMARLISSIRYRAVCG